MQIIDYTTAFDVQARDLVAQNYADARLPLPGLPGPMTTAVEGPPPFSGANGLGIAAVEEGKLLGFICPDGPIEGAFGSTGVRGVFAAAHNHGSVPAHRVNIYDRMYRAAADKWVKAGIVSHCISLYASDTELISLLFQNGFGMRLVDAVYRIDPMAFCPVDAQARELPFEQWGLIYELYVEFAGHFKESPMFINLGTVSRDRFMAMLTKGHARVFVAMEKNTPVAFAIWRPKRERHELGLPAIYHCGGLYCAPRFRGRGLVSQLQNCAAQTFYREGITHLTTTYESFNTLARGFWQRSFTPYSIGLVRRIDEHILLA